jgi:hypothetical protein
MVMLCIPAVLAILLAFLTGGKRVAGLLICNPFNGRVGILWGLVKSTCSFPA